MSFRLCWQEGSQSPEVDGQELLCQAVPTAPARETCQAGAPLPGGTPSTSQGDWTDRSPSARRHPQHQQGTRDRQEHLCQASPTALARETGQAEPPAPPSPGGPTMAGSRCLWVTLALLLAVASSAQEDDCCPPHKKTTTTTHHTTTPQTTAKHTTATHTTAKHTSTSHTTAKHTTATHTTAKHTSAPHTTAKHTTATHTTAKHTSATHTTAKHTTATHTTAKHTTATHTTANHTSSPHTTAKHTTATHTTANHTSSPNTTANHTTVTYTTANHTSSPHTTANHTTENTTATLTTASYTSTQHTPAPNTTMVPTKTPDVDVGEYTVSNGSEICLRVKLGLKLMMQYNGTGGQQVWGTVLVPGPAHTNASGNCSTQTATLRLTFPEGFVQFTFQKNAAKRYVYLSEVLLSVNHTFPHSKEMSFRAQNSSLHEFETLMGRSYQCKNVTIDVSSDVSLNMVPEQVQAFELKNGQFGRAEHCPADQSSMAVPIIVGVILAVLIVIVIVAYLIGRRRTHGGYQSI